MTIQRSIAQKPMSANCENTILRIVQIARIMKRGDGMRLIDANALREHMYHEAFETDSDLQKWDSGCWIRYKMFENILSTEITIEAEPIKHGSWVGIDDFPHEDWECTNCGYIIYGDDDIRDLHYCPNCGAKMDEVKE